VVLVRERTIPTERSPLVGEVSANFCGWGLHIKTKIYETSCINCCNQLTTLCKLVRTENEFFKLSTLSMLAVTVTAGM
jgi:hypothetical protein